MKDNLKYGFAALIGWNILIVLMAILAVHVRGIEYSAFFDDGIGGIGMCLFLLLWSLIWFYIGYDSRRKFVSEKQFYKEYAPLLDKKEFDKLFISHYVSRVSRVLAILSITAIPWYIIGYVRGAFETKDWAILAVLALLSVVFFGVYKIKNVSV
ncbi:MAG: hypothetical protein RSD11_04760 [Bacteroides sp.]|uniref:hypothetical protein n=2 Tax=Bacteroides sp. TaxID=29523 RepID=UPI002FC605BC